ncbi:MAG: putative pterin-4-alpha-carbinolamine dehydratase [Ignavibacteriaceae bacterium]|nr:putative pterin-4-alpha-carbinolamine dehydratase [Ignavibacteriaceae bacterium]
MALLNQDEITKKLSSISGWKLEENQIVKLFQFKDFAEALSFVNKVGAEAEKMDHHPDIFIHSWNKVKITISTHSEDGITKKDFQLAEKIEGLG